MPATFPEVWDLHSLLPDPNTAEFRTAAGGIKDRLQALAKQSESLPTVDAQPATVAAWTAFLQEFQDVDARLTDARAQVECHCAAHATDPGYLQWDAELSALNPWREQIGTAVELAFRDASPQAFTDFLAADPWLSEVGYHLGIRRRNALFRLPKAEESLAAHLAVDGVNAWGRLYDRVSGALKITVIEKGVPVTKSVGQVHFDSPDRSHRQNSFYAADAAWKGIEPTCAEAINHISGTRLTIYKRLGLRDHLDVPLHVNRMSRETLETMWGTIQSRKGVLLRYLSRKAQLLGIPKLAWYDQQAPLPRLPGSGGENEIPYDEACRLIIDSFHTFSSELGDFAEMSLKGGWIEAENRAGKRQGGFCTTYPVARQSRIFMTYTKTADSMSTLAHELGHAYHSYVLRDQPWFLADYPMNLAETASTFAEAVLGARRYENSKSDGEKLEMLDAALGDAVAFLMNIHARFLFEDEFHRQRASREVTYDELNSLMVKAQKTAYLDAFEEDGWNPRFWASKMHFYITGVPFYNFPYTFGYLLSLGLYSAGRSEGAAFAERFRRFLVATGSRDAEASVQETLGYDLRKPDFWNMSLDLIEQRVGEFETLADRLERRVRGE